MLEQAIPLDTLTSKASYVSRMDFVRRSLDLGEVRLHPSGATVVDTRPTTNRAESKNFKVVNPETEGTIDFSGSYNKQVSEAEFERLYGRIVSDLDASKNLLGFRGHVGVEPENRISLNFLTNKAYLAHFASILFYKHTASESADSYPQATILYSTDTFVSDEKKGDRKDGLFIVSNYDLKRPIMIIGGSKYPGEAKKIVFTLANWLFPQRGILTMHCSATRNDDKRTTLFFGLSGTGKTTLSALSGNLIGDDETMWSDSGISNLEAGCYAKCVDLSQARESLIWNATHRQESLIENVPMDEEGRLDFSMEAALRGQDGKGGTENTRSAYPLEFIPTAIPPDVYEHPARIVFLSYDTSGVLPAVSRIDDPKTALYYFLLGYTSKVAGTVAGTKGEESTFSFAFGAPFMPLKPMVYADLLADKIRKHNVEVYLVNTGKVGNPNNPDRKRVPLADTTVIVKAITSNALSGIQFSQHPLFRLMVPNAVPGVNPKTLDYRGQWGDNDAYDAKARELGGKFKDQMEKMSGVPRDIIESGP